MQAGAPSEEAMNMPPPNPENTSPLVIAHADELDEMVQIMSPEQRSAYSRVLKAGMTMMYSPETRGAMNEIILDKSIPMANKMGEGIANLVVMLDNEGNGTIPKDVLIPVGIALLFEVADYLFEVGMEVTEKDLSDGMEFMVYGIYEGYGIPSEEVDAMVDRMSKKLDLESNAAEEAAESDKVEPAAPPTAKDEEAEFEAGFAEEQQKRGV